VQEEYAVVLARRVDAANRRALRSGTCSDGELVIGQPDLRPSPVGHGKPPRVDLDVVRCGVEKQPHACGLEVCHAAVRKHAPVADVSWD
jgi:hypothetical protein